MHSPITTIRFLTIRHLPKTSSPSDRQQSISSYLDQDSVHAVEVGDGVAGRSRLEVIVGGQLLKDLRGDVGETADNTTSA